MKLIPTAGELGRNWSLVNDVLFVLLYSIFLYSFMERMMTIEGDKEYKDQCSLNLNNLWTSLFTGKNFSGIPGADINIFIVK